MKNDFVYYISVILIEILNALPRWLAIRVAGFIGEVWYLIGSRDKNIAHEQMEFVLDLSDKTLKAHARANFEIMIKNLVDIIRMKNWTAEYIGSIVEIEGLENFDREYNKGKGIIALTGHIGNFELMAAWFGAYKGYKVSVIGREMYDKRFDERLITQRDKYNVQNIPTTSSIKAILKALHDGHALGVLNDQDSRRVSGYFIDFFGRKAITAAGPMYIARKTGSPVVPVAIYRKPDDKYIIRVLPALDLEWTDNKEQDIQNALEKCNKAIEKLIMFDPLQWVWMHNRWRTRPPDENRDMA
ncbi:MAG: lysophospholipid acyltransferase family protein [candidate division Zixibacteria bacterium]|nr:lysophospholipid acyltransferase family protein [candidate division Zixibacteria bacterium]